MRAMLTVIAVSALLTGSALAADIVGVAGNRVRPQALPTLPSTAPATRHPQSMRRARSTLSPAKALEKGANSFTEGQARSRIESAGFTQVTGLHKDDQGIWRAKAMRDGKPVEVGFDYKGNIGAE